MLVGSIVFLISFVKVPFLTEGFTLTDDFALTDEFVVEQSGCLGLGAGGYRTCAVLDDRTVRCWGYNSHGNLGLENTRTRGGVTNEMGDNLPTVELGSGLGKGRGPVELGAGMYHTCAVLDDGSVKCWGYNAYGGLGLESRLTRGDGTSEMGDRLPIVNLGQKAVAVAAGTYHSCAILKDKSVKCWGYNSYGGLGQGDTSHRGDSTSEMGDRLPTVDLGNNGTRGAIGVSAGAYHSCAVLDDRTVKCWGYNSYGGLGQQNTVRLGDGTNEMGDKLPTVDLGKDRKAIAVVTGYNHNCALLDNSAVKCWGYNSYGSLGQGHTSHRGDGANEMGDYLPTVDLGNNRKAIMLAAGAYHSCAMLEDSSVKCWGYNSYGGLGYQTTSRFGDGANEMGDRLPTVDLGNKRSARGLTCGQYHTCAALDDNSVKCWGYNSYGNLGIETKLHKGRVTNEMGDGLPTVMFGSDRHAPRWLCGRKWKYRQSRRGRGR